MQKLLIYLILGLLGLKILWNLTLPYRMALMLLRSNEQRTSRITFMTFVEIILLLCAIATAWIFNGGDGNLSPQKIALWGIVAIVGSYIHLIIAGMIAGWIVSRIKQRKSHHS